jgi:transcriptional regulator ATRX
VLKPFLPPKHEFVISVALSDLQAQLYEFYIKNKSMVADAGASMRLFKDYQIMRLIWTHPLAMKLSADRNQKLQEKVRLILFVSR